MARRNVFLRHHCDAQKGEDLLEAVESNYGDVKTRTGTLADAAKHDLFEIRNLTIGKHAPEIVGQDLDGKTFQLSDYRGKVVFLDSGDSGEALAGQ